MAGVIEGSVGSTGHATAPGPIVAASAGAEGYFVGNWIFLLSGVWRRPLLMWSEDRYSDTLESLLYVHCTLHYLCSQPIESVTYE
jgi:hypothetical protein